MPDKKAVSVRFYSQTDEDLIEWLEGLATGEGNNTIKAMLRVGIAASQSGNGQPKQSISEASIAVLDRATFQSTLEVFLPRIREIVDASLASANFIRVSNEPASQDESMASTVLLKGHVLSDDEED